MKRPGTPEKPSSLTETKSVRKKTTSRIKKGETTDETSQIFDLFVLRHGEAGNRMSVAEKDTERPLTLAGRKEIERISRSLKSIGLKPDRILTSPLRRARETAEIAAEVLEVPRLEEWGELKPDGSRESLYRKLATVKGDHELVLVGHEPYLTAMIGEIIGTPGARLVLKKGGLGKVRIASIKPRLSGELRWLLTPKMITRMS